jgi:hypothetical protein
MLYESGPFPDFPRLSQTFPGLMAPLNYSTLCYPVLIRGPQSPQNNDRDCCWNERPHYAKW